HYKRIARSEVVSSFRRGHSEGHAEGLEKGLEEGELNAKREIARKLLRNGVPEEQVAVLTGLPASEIEKLAGGAKK
ncbi:MAG: hypothetical protein LBW77_00850, partial [Verrucomicrobiota bacterium]|nr:hypothetical protein [Verrucomicrobiota bacterium]